jgi:histone H3/H4
MMRKRSEIKKLIKEECARNGFEVNVSQDAVTYLWDQTEQFMQAVAKFALENMKAEGRKTILPRDIQLVLDSRSLGPRLIPNGKLTGSTPQPSDAQNKHLTKKGD